MRLVRLAAALSLSSAVAVIAAQQPPQAAARRTRQTSRRYRPASDSRRPALGGRRSFLVRGASRQSARRPSIPPTRIFDNVFAIGNSGTTVYVIRTSAGLLMIDALGGNDAQSTTAGRIAVAAGF